LAFFITSANCASVIITNKFQKTYLKSFRD
jgi:hypothetical protein